jgi:hypothetical protein
VLFLNYAPVPEPGLVLVACGGLAGVGAGLSTLVGRRRRRNQASA